MDFTVTQEDNTAVVKTNVARLNATNASELKAKLYLLNKNNVNNIVIDMSSTVYCDSSGLSSILVANRMCNEMKGKFVLCGLMPNVQKLIEIAQLDKVLTIVASNLEARAVIS